jgi:polyhydroxyalkanoate synthesis regulator phasin
MKTKTLIELLTLSTGIYAIAKDQHLLDRFNELSEKGKDRINDAFSRSQLDEEGNELELIDKVILKTSQLKEELEQKIEELIAQFYQKINIAHLDEIKALNERLEKSNKAIALIEARLNHLETKQ